MFVRARSTLVRYRRRGRVAVAAGLGIGLTMVAAGAADAAIIDHGSASGGTPCSLRTDIDSTCLLPFGPPVTEPTAVTRLALGDVAPSDVRVARPIAGEAGAWEVVAVLADRRHWAARSGTVGDGRLVDTAIRLLPGDQLVLIDPLVRSGAPATDFDLPAGQTTLGDRFVTGLPVGLEPTGSIATEPDVDSDGWGDTTQDLCPGVGGPICGPGTATVSIDGPTYVPALDPVSSTWTVTNTSTTPQPFVVNWYSRATVDQFTGPAGMVCADGRVTNPSGVLMLPQDRSPLLQSWLQNDGSVQTVSAFNYVDYALFGGQTCRLPVLAPGASTSGTIGGTGWDARGSSYGIQAEVIARFTQPGAAAPVTTARQAISRRDASKPSKLFAPKDVLAVGPASSPGRFSVVAACAPPTPTMTCPVTGELRTAIGGVILASATTPVQIPSSEKSTLTFSFTKAGLRWLAGHPRTKFVNAVLTTSLPRELATSSTTRVALNRSPSFKKQLKRLARRR